MQKTSVRVAILGHSGHGKTSLLRALARRFGRGGASSGGHSRWGETVAEVLAAIDRSI